MKKKISKRFFAMLMALVMLLGLAVPGFAAEDTHTYELYQIFTGDYADGILSNVKWGQNAKNDNGTVTVGTAVPESVLKELADLKGSTSDAEKLDTIKKYVNLESAPMNVTPSADANGSVTYSGLANGYYLIKDKER